MDYAQGRRAEAAGRVPPGYYTAEAEEAFEEEAAAEVLGSPDEILEALADLIAGDDVTRPIDTRTLTFPEFDPYGLSASQLLCVAVSAGARTRDRAWAHLQEMLTEKLQERIEARADQLGDEAYRGDVGG